MHQSVFRLSCITSSWNNAFIRLTVYFKIAASHFKEHLYQQIKLLYTLLQRQFYSINQKSKSKNKTMKKLFIASIALAMLAGCKKEKTAETASLPKNYIGTWNNVIPAVHNTPLDYYNLTAFLNEGGTGLVNSTRIVNGFVYPQGNASWEKLANDSVVITLALPAYPAEMWELRGISNANNTSISANAYRYPKNKSTPAINFGSIVLKK